MKHLFIPYELAVLAKQKGFDDTCLGEYYKQELVMHRDSFYGKYTNTNKKHCLLQDDSVVFSAPLYQQIVDWFKEERRMIKIYESENFLGLDNQWYVKKAGSRSIGPFNIDKAIEEAFKLI